MRILVDENLAPAVAEWFRSLGHDATHVRDEGLGGARDEAVLAEARAERRVLLTMDLDFGEIVARTGATAVAVVVMRLDDTRTSSVLARLAEVLPDLEATTGDWVAIVEPERIRIRHLPIGG